MSRLVKEGPNIDFTAAAETAPGTLVEVAGQAGIVMQTADSAPIPVGGRGTARVVGQVEIPKGAQVFAAGASVGYDQSADQAVTTGEDFIAGTAIEAAAAGDSTVKVWLNGHAAN